MTIDKRSDKEKDLYNTLFKLFEECPISDNEILRNLGLFVNRQLLSRILFMNELYKKILNVHGIVIEFGTRWGQNLSLFESFRGMYEPFNLNRKIVGFDSFKGFPSVHEKDGNNIKVGDYSVSKDYEQYLDKIMEFHEQDSPISHIKKFEVVKGDVFETLPEYLRNNPETIIAMAYFDLDIYEPTKFCLGLIKQYLTKGSVIGFDELNYHNFYGETIAVKEVLGLNNIELKRTIYEPDSAYIIMR